MAGGRRTAAGVGGAPAQRLSRYGVARPYRRGLRVLYGFSIRHLSSQYGDLGEALGWCRDLRCGYLLRSLVGSTLLESEDLTVDTDAWAGGAD